MVPSGRSNVPPLRSRSAEMMAYPWAGPDESTDSNSRSRFPLSRSRSMPREPMPSNARCQCRPRGAPRDRIAFADRPAGMLIESAWPDPGRAALPDDSENEKYAEYPHRDGDSGREPVDYAGGGEADEAADYGDDQDCSSQPAEQPGDGMNIRRV